jgi:hypothetical protein
LAELKNVAVGLNAEDPDTFILSDGYGMLLIIRYSEFDDVGQSRSRFCCGFLLLRGSFIAFRSRVGGGFDRSSNLHILSH